MLNGGGDNDTLYGNNGNDILNGGGNNDTLVGGYDNDTYVYQAGDGVDTISEYEYNANGRDTLQFGAGILTTDVVFSRNGNDLVLNFADWRDQITIQNWGLGRDYQIEQFTFADGTVWNSALIQSKATAFAINGTTGNDTLVGTAGDDTFFGGLGNDSLTGDAGNDTYIFLKGDGQDTISDSSGNDIINFGAGILPGDVTFAINGSDLVIGIAGTTDQITVQGWDSNTANRIELIQFADGTAWSDAALHSRIPNRVISGTAENDYLYSPDNSYRGVTFYGLAGDDAIYGNSGNDTLYGGAGNDTLNGGFGNDTYVVDSSGDVVTENANEGADTVQSAIAYALGTNIENLTLTGTDNLNGTGNALANTLTGNAGNNVLDGGTGTDTLIGGAGNDTYLINTLRDRVVETFNNGIDSIQANIPIFNRVSFFGKKIPSQFAPGPTLATPDNVENLSALGFARANLIGNELDNELTGNGADNVLKGMGGNDILIGGWGRDTLYGGSGNDIIDAGGGQDRLIGGTGSDTFVFNAPSDSSASLAFPLPDVITDFEPGTDKINLSAIDAASGGGNDAFLWGGSNVNTVANSVTWFDDGVNTTIRIDNTGDTVAEMQITLSGTGIGLDVTHFIL